MDETQFFLLHLSLMRDYLGLEFQELKETLPFEYDLESIIDDWVMSKVISLIVYTRGLQQYIFWYRLSLSDI